jgi:hypothetical protein
VETILNQSAMRSPRMALSHAAMMHLLSALVTQTLALGQMELDRTAFQPYWLRRWMNKAAA